jgi:protein gp37
MATISRIEWTDATWNPTVGCTKISPGCKHCYAEEMARRLSAMKVAGYENGFRLTLLPSRMEEPLKRRKPTVYFVNSMSDLFHNNVPSEYIEHVFSTIERAHWHTFQILTKRAERLAAFFRQRAVPSNAWIGVSVEDRKYGVPRIELLRTVPARIRFLSVEPLLEHLGAINLSGIHWVIVGGESGPRARPMSPDWVEDVHRQCDQQSVHFFFKQWGRWGADGKRRSKKANGRQFKGKEWDEMPNLGG